jgi:hypothetical protein
LHQCSTASSSSSSSSRCLSADARLAAAAAKCALHPAVQAYLDGSLGIAFSGGGFRYVFTKTILLMLYLTRSVSTFKFGSL